MRRRRRARRARRRASAASYSLAIAITLCVTTVESPAVIAVFIPLSSAAEISASVPVDGQTQMAAVVEPTPSYTSVASPSIVMTVVLVSVVDGKSDDE